MTDKKMCDCNQGRLPCSCKVEPVPPADVEELPATRTNFDYQHLGDDGYVAAQTWNECLKACTPIVIRLQAEVGRLGKRVEEEVATSVANELKAEHENAALQSELTKAREFERDALRYRFIRQGSSESDYICLSEIREGMDMAIDEALSNQSAPADKDSNHDIPE